MKGQPRGQYTQYPTREIVTLQMAALLVFKYSISFEGVIEKDG
jgi:hypothetical protein